MKDYISKENLDHNYTSIYKYKKLKAEKEELELKNKNITRELLSRTEKLKELGEENTSLKAQNDKLNEFLLLNDKQWQEKYDKLLEEHTEFYNYLDSNGMEE